MIQPAHCIDRVNTQRSPRRQDARCERHPGERQHERGQRRAVCRARRIGPLGDDASGGDAREGSRDETDRNGEFTVPDVIPGRYRLSVWHERAKGERATDFPRELTISPANRLIAAIRLIESDDVIPHKNKYGRDYLPSPPVSPLYK